MEQSKNIDTAPIDSAPCAGPFEVKGEHTNQATGEASEDETIERNLDCANYEKCLDLAAALDWGTFTCEGCAGEINESLKWRAGQSTRRDPLAKAICGEPSFSCITKGRGIADKART
ncbi:MAG: hypothetical protein ACK5Y6_08690 [Pseudomonadota bacterium]|jgi:hypothetical protein